MPEIVNIINRVSLGDVRMKMGVYTTCPFYGYRYNNRRNAKVSRKTSNLNYMGTVASIAKNIDRECLASGCEICSTRGLFVNLGI